MNTSEKVPLWQLFITFSKCGALTFGGGYAMLPILEREVATKRGWSTTEEMLNYYAIAQCTPGAIAVNVATFVGYTKRGVLGAIVATLGLVFPSYVIITLLASVLKMFQDNIYVVKAFSGIRIAVCALMFSAVISLAKKAVSNIPTGIVAVLSLILELFLGVSPFIVVLGAAACGIAAFFINRRKNDGGSK